MKSRCGFVSRPWLVPLRAMLALACLAAIPCHGIAAQRVGVKDSATARQDSTASRLNAIVVTATRTEQRIRDVAVSTSVLTRLDVQSTPAQALDEVLRTIPGVNLPLESSVVAHPTASSISMRGLGGIRTLVLLDGVPLNDPFAGFVQWNKVPMELIDHIEVVRGGSSSLFGSYALGGVINIVSRKPDTKQSGIEASYGTNNARRFNVSGSQAIGNMFHVSLNANHFNTDGYVRPIASERGPIDIAARSDVNNFHGRLGFDPSKTSTAYLTTNVYDFNQNQGSPLGTDGQHVVDVALGAEHKLSGGGSVKASVFGARDRFHTANTDPITARSAGGS